MAKTIHVKTTVLSGNRIEISSPDLREGDRIAVFVVLPEAEIPRKGSILEFLDSLPEGPRTFDTWEELEEPGKHLTLCWGECIIRDLHVGSCGNGPFLHREGDAV